MKNPTINFQNIWIEILSSRDVNLLDNLDKAKILIEEGADINSAFGGYLRSIRNNTPLYYLLVEYFRYNTYYLNDVILDDLLCFLFENNVMPDKESIRFCIRDTKLLEELLKRSDYNEFMYTLNPLSLETILGFTTLDVSITYNFSYISKDNCIHSIREYLLPIECIILDFIIKKGLTTESERTDIIHILKRNDSPSPSMEKLNKIISVIEMDSNENNKKLEEYYNYYNEYKF